MIDRIHRQVIGAGHGVIHVAARQKLAVIIIGAAFEQGLSDTLRDATVDLAFDNHRVHHIAEIIGAGEGRDFNAACIGVNFDLAGIGTGGVGEVGGIVEGGFF
jgi:hypothetical protein